MSAISFAYYYYFCYFNHRQSTSIIMNCAYDQEEEIIIMNEVKKWAPLLDLICFSLVFCGLTHFIISLIDDSL